MIFRRTVLSLAAASAVIFGLAHVYSTSADSESPREVTFTRDVAPIFFKNCVECHKPNDIAPMSLLTYKDARPWARSIKEKVANRTMPPWGADPHFGQFSNDRRLSNQDVETIAAWVDQGAKEGDAKYLPKAPDIADGGWLIGKPDAVVSMTEPYTIPAGGSDEYVYFVLPTDFKEDKWIKAVEIHPGNKKVVHHVIAFVQPKQQAEMMKAGLAAGGNRSFGPNNMFYIDGSLMRVKMDAQVIDDGCGNPNGGSAFTGQRGGDIFSTALGGYAPGRDVDTNPEGTARYLPAGSSILLQMHYSNFRGTLNTAETDRTSVGLVFADPSTVNKMIVSKSALNNFFKIPAGDPNHEVTACYKFDQAAQIVNFVPHMHLRGKDMTYELIYPDGKRQTVLSVPAYNFNWQTVYKLKEPLSVPKGSRMLVTAHFDNSERNKYNPNPRVDVRWGDPTYDDMMVGFFDCVVEKPIARPVAKINFKVYDDYVGRYQVGPGITFTITREGDHLFGQIAGQSPFELFPESETKFFVRSIEGGITFVKDEKGEVTGADINLNGMMLKAKRAKAVAANSVH